MLMKRKLFFLLIIVVFIVSACGGGEDENSDDKSQDDPTSAPAVERDFDVEPGSIVWTELSYSAEQTNTLFVELSTEESGITFENELSAENRVRYTYNGSGVASGDYDDDGLTDLYFVNQEGENRLYHNLGNMQFEDVTAQAGVALVKEGDAIGSGAHFVDTDNDGDLDLFVTNWRVPDTLFRNNGDGTFTDVTAEAGVGFEGGSTTTAVADFDRDGDLDMYVATYRANTIYAVEDGSFQLQMDAEGNLMVPAQYENWLEVVGVEGSSGLLRELGEPDLYYRNNGDGIFEEVSAEVGISDQYWGLSVAFSDVNNDGWVDIYVSNDHWSPDTLYINQGDGSFKLVEPDQLQVTPMFAMGMDFADINNDGLVDYFVADMLSRDHTLRMTQHGEMDMTPPVPDFAPQVMRNGLYLNNGDGSFSEIAWLADVAASEWTWSAKFADLDLDGFVDLMVTNGMVGDLMDSDLAEATRGTDDLNAVEVPPLDSPDMAFRNVDGLRFEEVSAAWGFNNKAISYGASLGDFDSDGDLDMAIIYLDRPSAVFRNDSNNDRLTVSLEGRLSNSHGIGARVTVITDVGTQSKIMSTSGGYLSGHEPILVFGLAGASEIQEIRVEWDSGHVQVYPDNDVAELPFNQAYVITEPTTAIEITTPTGAFANSPAMQFEEVSTTANITWSHAENEFDDFHQIHPLLPRKISNLGPGLAWGDADGDGDDDLYVAGSGEQDGMFFTNNGDSTFSEQPVVQGTGQRRMAENPEDGTFEETLILPEGMAPLWWQNGISENPALVLAYSSAEAGSLLNPVGAVFTPAPDLALTDWSIALQGSKSSLASADFDGDGDLDVFMGGRVMRNQWTYPAPSHLFANENGGLVNVTDEVAPELNNLGMVTGSVWVDIDHDGDPDLLAATEWGPVHLLLNEGGQLTVATEAAGLAQWTGFWNGVAVGDFDRDGDMDFAATNLGLNTRYRASAEYPMVVFAGDVDLNDNFDLVEAYYVDGELYPIRERGMMSMDVPMVMSKFNTFAEYADKTIAEIFGEMPSNVRRSEANTLAHSVFLNDGSGVFTRADLPTLSQVSIGFGISVADLDNDGLDDLYMAGNFFGADHENMAYAGGTSYWLRGNGDGTFTVVPSAQSGLNVPYDARGVAVADYDQDGWIDIAISINDDVPLLFRNKGVADHNSISVKLTGSTANPTGVGARIIVTHADGSTTTREIHAGSGYLSQDSATQIFGLGTGQVATVRVEWPDGTISAHLRASAGEMLVVSYE